MNPNQAWFWTPEWQAGEREADEQAERGEGEVFYSSEGFLRDLRQAERELHGGKTYALGDVVDELDA